MTYYYFYDKKKNCIYDESGNKYAKLDKSCGTCNKPLDSDTTCLYLCG